MSKRLDRSRESQDAPFNSPFAGLGKLRDKLPEGEKPKPPPPRERILTAVLRFETAGRGGKEVTVVEQLGLPLEDLLSWARELRNTLGCGGAVEGTRIVLQGDQRERLPTLLQSRGVRLVAG